MKKYLLTLSIILMGTLSIYANNWKISVDVDEMTGERSCSVDTKWWIYPTKPLKSWLYKDLKSVILLYPESIIPVLLAFSSDIVYNWSNETYTDDLKYVKSSIRVKFDNNVKRYRITQPLDSSSIYITDGDGADFIDRASKADSILIELPLYDEGNVYFQFTGAGLEAKLQECISQF